MAAIGSAIPRHATTGDGGTAATLCRVTVCNTVPPASAPVSMPRGIAMGITPVIGAGGVRGPITIGVPGISTIVRRRGISVAMNQAGPPTGNRLPDVVKLLLTATGKVLTEATGRTGAAVMAP